MIFFACICLWLLLQSRHLAKALRAKAEADHRLRMAQIELMKAAERRLRDFCRESKGGGLAVMRWKPGKN